MRELKMKQLQLRRRRQQLNDDYGRTTSEISFP